jgi:hypothetical protein
VHEQLVTSFLPYLEEYFDAVTRMIKIPVRYPFMAFSPYLFETPYLISILFIKTEPLDAPRPLSQIRILSSAYSAIVEDSRALCDMLIAEQRMNDIVKHWESGLLDSLMKGAEAGLQGQ